MKGLHGLQGTHTGPGCHCRPDDSVKGLEAAHQH